MQIHAKCPQCGQVLQLNLNAADKRITCSGCAGIFKVPDLDHLRKAVKVIKDANSAVFVDLDGNIYG